ncbi:MAG: hypothetical protein M3Q26_04320 [Acidobacteriota bacterium]|nr:hypothetical protein [Acidobacteriota bacterium]
MRFVSLILVFSIFVVTSQIALARVSSTFMVETLVSEGKKSKEVNSTLNFGDKSFRLVSNKPGLVSKEMTYSEIKTADYSYSKKPLLSTGGAVAMAILTGLIVLPFLFMKKKQHWLTVRTDNDYAVMKLDKENFRQIQSEFEIKKVKITTLNEDDNKKEK